MLLNVLLTACQPCQECKGSPQRASVVIGVLVMGTELLGGRRNVTYPWVGVCTAPLQEPMSAKNSGYKALWLVVHGLVG